MTTAALFQDKMPLLLTLASRFDMCHQLAVVLRAQPSPQNPRCTQVEKGEVEGRIPAAGLAAEILAGRRTMTGKVSNERDDRGL